MSSEYCKAAFIATTQLPVEFCCLCGKQPSCTQSLQWRTWHCKI